MERAREGRASVGGRLLTILMVAGRLFEATKAAAQSSSSAMQANDHQATAASATGASTQTLTTAAAAAASSSMTSEPITSFPLYMRLIATLACLIIFTIGVCGNLLVPLVVIKTRYLRNSTNLFLINLSVADLLVLIVCMPTVLIELHSRPETWLLGEPMCKLSNFVEMLAANGSIFTILAISFERYYAICKPLKAGYKCTRLRATIIICLIWLLACILTSPILVMAKSLRTTYIDGSLVDQCILETDTYWPKMYVFVSMFAFFCLPLLVLMLVYWLISRRLIRESIAMMDGSLRSHCESPESLRGLHCPQGRAHPLAPPAPRAADVTNNMSSCPHELGHNQKRAHRMMRSLTEDRTPSEKTKIMAMHSALEPLADKFHCELANEKTASRANIKRPNGVCGQARALVGAQNTKQQHSGKVNLIALAHNLSNNFHAKRVKRRSGSQPLVVAAGQLHTTSSPAEFYAVRYISKKHQMDSRRQVVVMLAFVVACFFLLFFPYRVFTIWLILSTQAQVQSLGMETYYNLTYFSRILIYLHSAINPIAYNLISTKFRRAFMSILLCRGSATRRNFTTDKHRYANECKISRDKSRLDGAPKSPRHNPTITSDKMISFKTVDVYINDGEINDDLVS